MSAREDFDGAKMALFLGDALAVIRRDDIPGLAYAGCLDLPGGQREPGETPEACVLRELREELSLALDPSELTHPRFYTTPTPAWFFAAFVPAARADEIVLGDEGQGWSLMKPEAFIAAEDAVPHLQDRVRVLLDEMRR